jgi:hypothetical protein
MIRLLIRRKAVTPHSSRLSPNSSLQTTSYYTNFPEKVKQGVPFLPRELTTPWPKFNYIIGETSIDL